MKVLYIILLVFACLAAITWLGLRVKPVSFAMPTLRQLRDEQPLPLPENLPAPVERFYKAAYVGNEIPVIKTAVFTGHARIRPFGIWLPARFVFVHNTGLDYRHYIEATLFGIPFLKVNEGYIDGDSFFESPMGSYSDDPNTNQAANLALWAEAGWFPSIWLTHTGVHWEAVDENTARLFVPYENKTEDFLVRFNPQTGLIDTMEAMRYRDPGEGKPKILWVTRNESGGKIPGTNISAVGSATWQDQGSPWAVFTIEESRFNVDVSTYIHLRGH